MTTTPKVSNWNLPNALTVLRVFMVPVYAYLLVTGYDSPTMRWIATAIFALAMATDQLDGHIARSRNLITDFGKIADPIADKALIGAALIIFSLHGVIWWWVTAIILLREVGITVMRFTVLRYGVIPANAWGKWKTILQAIAMGSFTWPVELYWGAWTYVAYVVLGAAFILTVTSGFDYVRHGIALRRAHVQGSDA
ncbi:CDP-diacylglycerol--glycerol-3-phosphate 3-phosphatidyltransferase [Micrococcales bacterium 31B]|nr:CDP-diacylglycerol--glycerol-3-phosphate 3-phosphatidyltransferase [Micrococcales bacterium 31B]